MKKITLVLVMLLVAALVFGCASTPSPTPSKPASSAPATAAPSSSAAAPPASSAASVTPIKIGALLSMTGEGQLVGPGDKAALEFRLDQIGYQVAGRKIQLVSEDDATDPVTGVDKAKKLVQSDKVDVILGPVHGAVGPAVANYVSKMSIPQILFMSKVIGVLKLGGGNIFLPWGTDAGIGYRAGDYAVNKAGFKTAVFVYEDFVSGKSYADSSSQAFEKMGGKVIQQVPVKQGTVDFAPYVTSIQQADVVMFWFTPPLAQRFTAQFYQSGIKSALMLVLSSQLMPRQLAAIGDKCIGMVGISQYSPLIDTPTNKDYVAAFTKKYDPNLLMDQGVSADICLDVYLDALKATNGDATPAKVIEALHKVKTDTPAGITSFNTDGLGIANYYIQQVAKTNDVLGWKVIQTYSQVPMDAPTQ
jgi:branched-chain amino acid transport system substrate-binding protein